MMKWAIKLNKPEWLYLIIGGVFAVIQGLVAKCLDLSF